MSSSATIVSEDLQAFALNAGGIKPGQDLALDYGHVLTASINQFGLDSGYVPFIAETQTRTYDLPFPNGKIIDFRAGLLSVSSFTVDNTSLTEGVDYRLYPYNAPVLNRPYLYAKLITRFRQHWPWQLPGLVSITGEFGFSTTWPDDVKHAILCLACTKLMPTKKDGATGMIQRIKQDDVEYQYVNNVISPVAYTPQQMQWIQTYEDTLSLYSRIRVT